MFTSNSTKKKHLLKNEIDVDCFKKHHKELLKNNKLIFKTRQRFKSDRKMFSIK